MFDLRLEQKNLFIRCFLSKCKVYVINNKQAKQDLTSFNDLLPTATVPSKLEHDSVR